MDIGSFIIIGIWLLAVVGAIIQPFVFERVDFNQLLPQHLRLTNDELIEIHQIIDGGGPSTFEDAVEHH